MKNKFLKRIIPLMVVVLTLLLPLAINAGTSAKMTVGTTVGYFKYKKTSLVAGATNNTKTNLAYKGIEGDPGAIRILKLGTNIGYCLEPHKAIAEYNGDYYTPTIDYGLLPEPTTRKLWLAAYYGYQYPNHQTNKYYAATQALIWEALGYQVGVYQTMPNKYTAYNHNYIKAEYDEIVRLMSIHDLRPSFAKNEYNLNVGQTITLTDTNECLENYSITAPPEYTVVKNGNDVSITLNSIPTESEQIIMFNRIGGLKLGTTLVWGFSRSSYAQRMLSAYEHDPLQVPIYLGGRAVTNIELLKQDVDFLTPIPDATFELYNITDPANPILISTKVTDLNGKIRWESLNYSANYRLIETGIPEGYELIGGQNTWDFTPSSEPLQETFTVKANNRHRRLTLNLIKQNDAKNLLLDGAIFEVTNIDTNQSLGKYITGGIYFTGTPNTQYDLYNQVAYNDILNNDPTETFTTDSSGDYSKCYEDGTYYVFSHGDKTTPTVFEVLQGTAFIKEMLYGNNYNVCEIKQPTGYYMPQNPCEEYRPVADVGINTLTNYRINEIITLERYKNDDEPQTGDKNKLKETITIFIVTAMITKIYWKPRGIRRK